MTVGKEWWTQWNKKLNCFFLNELSNFKEKMYALEAFWISRKFMISVFLIKWLNSRKLDQQMWKVTRQTAKNQNLGEQILSLFPEKIRTIFRMETCFVLQSTIWVLLRLSHCFLPPIMGSSHMLHVKEAFCRHVAHSILPLSWTANFFPSRDSWQWLHVKHSVW